MTVAEDVIEAATVATGDPVVVRDLNIDVPRQNQLVFFIKPECFLVERQNLIANIVELMLDSLDRFKVSVDGAVVFPGASLARLHIMDAHYGYINAVSRGATSSLAEDELNKVRERLGVSQEVSVFGGHEVLEKYPTFTPETLEELWATKKSEKIRSGLYAQSYELDDVTVALLNGFHPQQLAHFTNDDRRTAVFVVSSDLPWSVLRQQLVGDTFPERAVPGSIRRTLYDRSEDLGLGPVGIANNGCHLSAGPFEALFEMQNFFSSAVGLDVTRSTLARTIARATGEGSGNLAWVYDNPTADIAGNKTSLFDATEDLDATSASHFASIFFRPRLG